MPHNGGFWRNAVLIGIAHVVVLAGLARWSGSAKRPASADIVWMEGGAITAPAAMATQVSLVAKSETESTPAPVEEPTVKPMEDPLTMPTPPPADIEEPTPTATPKPAATPQPTATPRSTPTPRATPQPSPKRAAAKASPKPTAMAKNDGAVKKPSVKSAPKKVTEPTERKGSDTPAASDAGADSGGSGGRASGAGGASDVGWYGNMLHDRFHGEWVQPKTAASTGAKMTVLIQLRIEKDGRVSDFRVVRSSGNVVVDESVAAVANRVTRVDPPPAGLSATGHYDVRINFELNVE